jgi:hypothetical protein
MLGPRRVRVVRGKSAKLVPDCEGFRTVKIRASGEYYRHFDCEATQKTGEGTTDNDLVLHVTGRTSCVVKWLKPPVC